MGSFGCLGISLGPFLYPKSSFGMTFGCLLGSLGSHFGSMVVLWPPLGASLAPQGETGEKSEVLERKGYPFGANGAKMVKVRK